MKKKVTKKASESEKSKFQQMSNELKECKLPVTFKIASNENVGIFFSYITINKKIVSAVFSLY